LISGFIPSKIADKPLDGIVMDVVRVIVGAVARGVLFAQFGAAGLSILYVYSSFVAVIGAIVVLLNYHAVVHARIA
jgi:uncharacterized membrane protein YeaQ/YmgE (transglycosylase-associated protein family)